MYWRTQLHSSEAVLLIHMSNIILRPAITFPALGMNMKHMAWHPWLMEYHTFTLQAWKLMWLCTFGNFFEISVHQLHPPINIQCWTCGSRCTLLILKRLVSIPLCGVRGLGTGGRVAPLLLSSWVCCCTGINSDKRLLPDRCRTRFRFFL